MRPNGCPTGTDYQFTSRVAGFSDTDVVSTPSVGPTTVTYSAARSSTSSWTYSGSATFSISALIADASTTFGVSYTTGNTSTQMFSYSKTIAAGKTGVVKMKHVANQLADNYVRMNANCTDTLISQSVVVVPLSGTGTYDYCIVGDYSPYQNFKAGSCSSAINEF